MLSAAVLIGALRINEIQIFSESAHNKTYKKNCLTRKYTDQPVHPLGMARVLVYPSLDSLKAVEVTCDQQILI